MRRALMLAASSIGIVPVAGCLMVPYEAYPKLDYTPGVKLEAPAGEVHAFRVDTDKPTYDTLAFINPETQTAEVRNFVETNEERLTELPVANADEAPTLIRPSFTYGFAVYGALTFVTHTSHSVALRLYRPGYELVEIKSWELGRKVEWKPAVGFEAQEKVLDKLFECSTGKWPKSPANRAALRFGASEYERLDAAQRPPTVPLSRDGITDYERLMEMHPTPIPRTRLTDKADRLRKCAEE